MRIWLGRFGPNEGLLYFTIGGKAGSWRWGDGPISAIDRFIEQRLQVAAADLFHRLLEISGVHKTLHIARGIQSNTPPENLVAQLRPQPHQEQRPFDVRNLSQSLIDIFPLFPMK